MRNVLLIILFGFLLGWMFLLNPEHESEGYGYGL